jgi:Protein of unknown function, DUF547
MEGSMRHSPPVRLLRRLAIMALLALPLAGFASLETLFAPSAELWPRWQQHDPAATTRLDHGAWDALLTRYRRVGADGIARFAYGGVSAADRTALKAYIGGLQATAVSGLARGEQLAFWVNLYNALTIETVLAHYPVASIRDINISPGLFATGPWDKKLVTIEGERVSLNDIEHRILRPIWRDPRIHYVVNCASLGCPDLPPQALTAANVETVLEGQARSYVNHPRGVELAAGGLRVSSIYTWFSEDFGGSEASVIEHLRRHAEPGLAERLARVTAIAGHGYDWALNDGTR